MIEKRVERLRREYDELKSVSLRQRKQLDALKDSVKDLELDSQRPHMEDNEFTRQIRALENKLDKAMIQYNEAQVIIIIILILMYYQLYTNYYTIYYIILYIIIIF
jgi:coiled-coil domain-containing protein 151